MRGPKLSYDEHLRIAYEMFVKGEQQDIQGWDGGANTELALSDEEVKLFTTWLNRRFNGCVDALTEKNAKLSKMGAQLLIGLLEVAGKPPKVSPIDVFWALHKAVIMVPMECVILRPSIDDPQETLLARRESNDPFFPGEEWHSPGAIMGVGETHLDAARRCLVRETECEPKRMMAVAANNVPNFCRGHERSQIWVVELMNEPTPETMEKHRLGWFRLDNLPGNLLRCHVPIHAKVRQWLAYYNALPTRDAKQAFLQATCPIESLDSMGG